MESLFTILPFGEPGTGKSKILNALYSNNCEAQYFPSGEGNDWGLTKEIKVLKNYLFNNKKYPQVRLIDMPGSGDKDINFENLI